MSLNARELADAAAEIAPLVEGSRVRDVGGWGEDDLVFFLEISNSRTEKLLFSSRDGLSRFHRCAGPPPNNGAEPSPPTLQLSARLRGARLQQISSAPGDRIVNISFAQPSGELLNLRFELFGKRGNWILSDAGGRVRLLKLQVQSKHRLLKIGEPDALPPPPPHADDAPSRFPPPSVDFVMNRAVEDYYTPLALAESLQIARAGALSRTEARLKAKNHRILGIETHLKEASEAPALRRRADLLRAAQQQIPRGAREASVVDYYETDCPNIIIVLDPAVPLSTQIEKMYHRARRLEAGAERAAKELEYNKEERRILERSILQLQNAPSVLEIQQITAELEKLKLLSAPRPPKSRSLKTTKKNAAPEIRSFTSADGLSIQVGKGARENDHLTFHIAHGNDLWLHAGGGSAGAHVVVRLDRGQSAPLETLLDAATLAIEFSKSRGRGRAEVVYTQAKHVSKPRGAPAGLVTLTGEKRIIVDFDRPRLDRLLHPPRPSLES